MWDKRYGGNNRDELFSLQQTSDGGFILGGWTNSDSTGEVSQASRGGWDYWIVKTDALGNKKWDKRYGGLGDEYLYSLKQTIDGGFILGGSSNSDISGDVSEPTQGLSDYWIVKTDSIGNKMWDKRYGGNLSETMEFGTISQTSDTGYLIAGSSKSSLSGDKTENNLGQEQTWIVKTDSKGTKQWDKTLLTNAQDQYGLALQTSEGCYLFANHTQAGLGGDKTEPSQGGADFWITEFCDTSLLSTSIPKNSFLSTISFFPNPCSDKIHVQNLPERETQIKIYNYTGSCILSFKSRNEFEINLGQESKGFYLVEFISENQREMRKLILE